MTRRYDQALKPLGVRSTQLPILVEAALHDRVNVFTLADHLMVDRTTLSRNLALLERKGWITIAPGADRRTREVCLTRLGDSILRQAIPLWEQAQEAVTTRIGAQRLRRVLSDLDATTTAMTTRQG